MSRFKSRTRKADYWNPTPMAEKLMEIDNKIWDAHGWQSGNDIDWDTYIDEIATLRNYGVDPSSITAVDLDDLTDSNYHSMRKAIEELSGGLIAKKARRSKVALRKRLAANAIDLADEIKELLVLDGPFENEDAVNSYINSCIDDRMIYDDDLWEVIQDYANPSDIIGKDSDIMDSFIGDVYEEIGDVSSYIVNFDEWEDAGWNADGVDSWGHYFFTMIDKDKSYDAYLNLDDGSIELTITDNNSNESKDKKFDNREEMQKYVDSTRKTGKHAKHAKRVNKARKVKTAFETDKKTFVEGVLTDCLRETREPVDYCAYYQDGGEEYISIVFENGQSMDVNVTADSNLAILYDVYKTLTQ